MSNPKQKVKVHIILEGHKMLRNLHRRFDWHYKYTVKISQNFVAFSEYMNFMKFEEYWFHTFFGVDLRDKPNVIRILDPEGQPDFEPLD